MILLAAILLAIFVLDPPWTVVAVSVGAVAEVSESIFWIRWSQHRRAKVGAETLIGQTAEVVTPLAPVGQVHVKGELWRARSTGVDQLPAGATVRILALEDLTLMVEPVE